LIKGARSLKALGSQKITPRARYIAVIIGYTVGNNLVSGTILADISIPSFLKISELFLRPYEEEQKIYLKLVFKMDDIEKLSTVRGFLLDMDGTFYLGDRLLEGALRFIDLLRKQKKEFLFLTNNSSKHGSQYAEKISRLGLPLTDKSVLTSGEATALYLKERHPGADLFLVGTPSLEEEFRQHSFHLVQQEPQVIVLGFDTTLTYNKLWALCDFVRAGIPFIATHPDFNCPTEKGFMPDVGAMIAFVKAATGRQPDLVVGKPNRLIVEAAAVKMNLQVNRLAMIGDRLYTDIALGQTSGITTILVLSGETKLEDLRESPFQPDYTFKDLAGVADWLERNC
jgi:4-nitrophenyl phosphatase